jgi:hypothetical protein
MATRDQRLGQFVTDREAPTGIPVQVLCEDHIGTYILPFPCRRADGIWTNERTGEAITCPVVGWRDWLDRN